MLAGHQRCRQRDSCSTSGCPYATATGGRGPERPDLRPPSRRPAPVYDGPCRPGVRPPPSEGVEQQLVGADQGDDAVAVRPGELVRDRRAPAPQLPGRGGNRSRATAGKSLTTASPPNVGVRPGAGRLVGAAHVLAVDEELDRVERRRPRRVGRTAERRGGPGRSEVDEFDVAASAAGCRAMRAGSVRPAAGPTIPSRGERSFSRTHRWAARSCTSSRRTGSARRAAATRASQAWARSVWA